MRQTCVRPGAHGKDFQPAEQEGLNYVYRSEDPGTDGSASSSVLSASLMGVSILYRHLCRRVYRHVYGGIHTCIEACVGMCIGICIGMCV